jgi:hypothetical protein
MAWAWVSFHQSMHVCSLIQARAYLLQPPISVRPLGQAFVQSFWRPILWWQFFAHELLYLYTTSKKYNLKFEKF